MKITTLTVLLFLSTITNLMAQNKYNLCVKGSFGSSNVKKTGIKESSDFATGIGVESYIKILPKSKYYFYINPSIEYNNLRYNGNIILGNNVKNVTVNYITFSAPIMIVPYKNLFSKEDRNFFFGLSPYIAFATSGKYNTIQNDNYVAFKFGNSLTDDRSSTDAGLRLKLGITTNRVVLNICKDIDLTNNAPNDRATKFGESLNIRSFMFQMSYRIF